MKKKIIISHGDKGGCGKSFIATLIGSELERRGKSFILIETDSSEDGGQADVAPRFRDSQHGQVEYAPLHSANVHTEVTVGQIFDLIDRTDNEVFLINVPAGASETLNSVADLFVGGAEEIGAELRITYSMFPHSASLRNAEETAKGLFGQAAKPFVLIANGGIGEIEQFKMEVARRKLTDLPLVTIPALSPKSLDPFKNAEDKNFADLADDKSMSVFTRRGIRALLDSQAQDLFNLVLAGIGDEKPAKAKKAKEGAGE